jgi:DNA-binding NarL/FixJ family response regulator
VPIRCMVVDDQPEFLETVRHLLDRQGISVVGVAANSAEAMKRAADLRPDVVLIDVHLGEESGLELASRIAAHGQAGSPRVILISTYPKGDLAGALPTGSSIQFVSKTDLSATTIRTALGLTPDDESTG